MIDQDQSTGPRAPALGKRVLVTWGSKMGGTAGLAHMIAEELREGGADVVEAPAAEVRSLEFLGIDAVVVGGALYANRWHSDARRFVRRCQGELRRLPVWFFSSGPLDDSATEGEIPPPRQCAALMERVGALGHATFGGRLPADAKGFPARAMAAGYSGDYRDRRHVRTWVRGIIEALPAARPGEAMDPPGGSLGRLLAYGGAGWALCGALLYGLLQLLSSGAALAVHAIAIPLVFTAVSWSYFRARGARDPLPTAAAFAAIVLVLDALVIAGLLEQSFALFRTPWAVWVPAALIFVFTWGTGSLMATLPWAAPEKPKPAQQAG